MIDEIREPVGEPASPDSSSAPGPNREALARAMEAALSSAQADPRWNQLGTLTELLTGQSLEQIASDVCGALLEASDETLVVVLRATAERALVFAGDLPTSEPLTEAETAALGELATLLIPLAG